LATLGVYRTFLIEFLFFSIRNGFSLSEALDILLNEDTEGDIFIEPPYPHIDTDVDSADEDGSG